MQKIDIDLFDEDQLTKILKKNHVGDCPSLLILIPNKDISWVEATLKLEKVFLALSIDPRFPYPTYLLNPENIATSHFFPQLATPNEAPSHFKKKIKRLKNREQTMLVKTITMSNRIKNHSVPQSWSYIKEKSFLNKTLRNLCHEKAFYEDILQELQNPKSEEQV